jgi:hypothetical protein
MNNLDEMSVAGYGDWQENIAVWKITAFVASTKYQDLHTFNINGTELKILKLKVDDYYVIGEYRSKNDIVEFYVYCTLELKHIPDILDYTNIYNVDGVKVASNKQGYGFARYLYKYLVKQLHFTFLGDETQYFGARKLWAHLSKSSDIIVDIIDIAEPKLLQTDAVIHHGNEDWDFDLRIWSYDTDKKHIRLILKDIHE